MRKKKLLERLVEVTEYNNNLLEENNRLLENFSANMLGAWGGFPMPVRVVK